MAPKSKSKSDEAETTEEASRLAFNASMPGGMYFDGREFRKATKEEVAEVEHVREYNSAAKDQVAEVASGAATGPVIQSAPGGGAPTGDGAVTPTTGGGGTTT